MNQFSNPKSTGSPYLPNYLLGSNSSSPANVSYGTVYGGLLTKSQHGTPNYQQHRSFSRTSPTSQNRMPNYSMNSPDNKFRQNKYSPTSTGVRSMHNEKLGAPPTESLYSTSNQFDESSANMDVEHNMLQKKMARFSNVTPGREQYYSPSQTRSPGKENMSLFSPRKDTTIQSPAQIDPFFTQGNDITSSDVLDDSAVTVFGFPPAASSFILQQFAQFGTIECHEIHNAGNWLHIKYQTKIQAKKALSKNGKIFARSIMIGVCPCIKKELARMEERGEISAAGENLSVTPGKPKIGTKRVNPTSIRSLSSNSSSSFLHNSSIGNLPTDHGTPQKKDSVVSKALDYVFGW